MTALFCPVCFVDKPSLDICPSCAFDESDGQDAELLPYRHRLGEERRYVVGHMLGKRGGFGVAYRALDVKQGAVVVIKECLLTESRQVWRQPGETRVRVNPGFSDEYEGWLRRFRIEAETIQRFDSPYIVRVTDIFDENNTSYFVMPLVDGDSLGVYCQERGGRLSEEEVTGLALQLLSALTMIHASKVIHRDIKPSNIIITRNKRKPVLIDFGAAREDFDSDVSRSHMLTHSPNHSPYEQVVGSKNQGTWTDIYAFCATLHQCLVGKPPPRSMDRVQPDGDDPYVPIHVVLPHLGANLATLINNGLAVHPSRRVRDAATAIKLLEDESTKPAPPPQPERGPRLPPQAAPAPEPPPFPRASLFALLPAAVLILVGFGQADFFEYLFGFPGLLVLVNGIGWVVWYLKRATPVPFRPPHSRSTGLDATSIDAQPGSVVGVELHVDLGGAQSVVRTMRPLETLTIGRTDQAHVVVPNEMLSKRHAKVEVLENGEFKLTDLQSMNHTYRYRRSEGGQPGSWEEVESVSGRKGRFMLGPPEAGGVLLEIRPVNIRR